MGMQLFVCLGKNAAGFSDQSQKGLIIVQRFKDPRWTQHSSDPPITPTAYLQVMPTPRYQGSKMRLNPTLAKEQARRVAEMGMVLWRQVKAAGSSNNSSRISLAPAQIRQVLNSFAADSEATSSLFSCQRTSTLPTICMYFHSS